MSLFGLQVVVKVKQLILTGPESVQDEAQVQMYLLALKNALLPEAIPLLTRFAESETGALSTIAITTLQRYDPQLITHEVSVLNDFHLYKII